MYVVPRIYILFRRIFLEIAAKLAGQLSIVSEKARRAQSLKIVTS